MLELVASVVFACGLAGIIIFGGCILDITLISYVTPAIFEKQNLIVNSILDLPVKCGGEYLLYPIKTYKISL